MDEQTQTTEETQEELNARLDAVRVSFEDTLDKLSDLGQAAILASLMGKSFERFRMAMTLMQLAAQA
jgi:signal transduction histidine kinase